MKYVIFETEFGFFGILGENGSILRTSLPVAGFESAAEEIIGGFKGLEFDKQFMPDVQIQIKAYFSGKFVEFCSDIPVLTGNLPRFSRAILSVCRKISYGKRVSYAELARMANHPKAARAVGNVMGNNPLPLLIPCHRVIKSDGTPGGFQRNSPEGAKLKKRMLDMEAKQKI